MLSCWSVYLVTFISGTSRYQVSSSGRMLSCWSVFIYLGIIQGRDIMLVTPSHIYLTSQVSSHRVIMLVSLPSHTYLTSQVSS